MENDPRSYKKQLEALLKVVNDGKAGYKHAAGMVKSDELKRIFNNYANDHEHVCEEIQKKISPDGTSATLEEEDDKLGVFSRAKLNLETSFEDNADEKAALGLCRERDRAVLEQFDEILQGSILETDLKPFLMTMRYKISVAYDEMEKLYFERFKTSPEM